MLQAVILVFMLANDPELQTVQQAAEVTAQFPEPAAPPPSIVQEPAPTPPPPPRLVPFTLLSTVFDSNVNRDTADLDSYGMVAGIGATFKNNALRPDLELQYQAGFHRYAATDRWDRVSHYLRAAWSRRLTRRFTFEQVGEISIKGSTEDHELSNQAVVAPRLEYRVMRWLRIRGLGAWRVKRYEDTPDRNAFNRYAGLELLGRPRSGLRWDVGGRAELNATASDRQRYERWTWYFDVSAPVGKRDKIEFGSRFRRQRYPYRFVDVSGGPDVLRRDRRIEPEIDWTHALNERVDLRLGYAFDGRDSNDVRREYRSHQALLGILTRW